MTQLSPTPVRSTSPTETKERVLRTAARLFARQGYKATTLRDIAAACRMKAGSLYYHFTSKEEILSHTMDRGVAHVFEAARDAVAAVPATAPSRTKIRAAIRGHLSALFVHGDYTSTSIRLYQQAPPAVQAQNRALRDRYEEFWNALFLEAKERGQIRPDLPLGIVRLFLFGGMNWTNEWYQDTKQSFDELADAFTIILMDGMGSR